MDSMQQKAIRARRRFKAIVRLVIANRAWLEEDLVPEQMVGGLKKNVQLLTKKRPLKSVLALHHKALLNMPAADRTEEEKILLYRIIGGFKCFRKYPEHVKMMLAANTYFAYYGADRTIVRQHHRAEALYFIISGEVSISIETYDPILNENVTTITGTMTAGSAFGEISLLNDVPRPSTIISTTPVEFLLLKREDFNVVLKDSVRQEWDYIITALNGFTYFDSWDDVTKTECCLLAKVKTFEKGQTILGDGEGWKSWVHLVLSGKCQVIEHLLIEPEYQHGKKRFKLYQGTKRNTDFLERNKPRISIPTLSVENVAMKTSEVTLGKNALARIKSSLSGLRTKSETDSHGSELEIDTDDVTEDVYLPDTVETYFMQVCIYSEKACFGIGENMCRRRVVALTETECLIIPRYWIVHKGNIWLRIKQYLQTHIPTTQELFQEFLEQRKWREHRKELVRSQIHRQPCNAPQNVPYSVRIDEDFEYKEAIAK